MAFAVPGAITPGNIEVRAPIPGGFEFPLAQPVQGDALQANDALEVDLPSPEVQPSHNLVHYSVFNFEGGILNAPPLPPAVKEQILFATASYKDVYGRVHIHKNFGFSQLSPFEVATLYRVINSYHKFWENIQTPGQGIYHKHLELMEEYLVGLAWEDPERASQVTTLLSLFQDGNLQGLIDKVNNEIYQANSHTRIEHANLLIQHAILCFNYNEIDNQPKLLSEAVKKQIQHASCCFRKNDTGELVIHKNFTFEHLSAQDVVMLYQVLESYYRTWDSLQNGADAVFNNHLAQMEEYFVDLCWSNLQKARNVRAAINRMMDPIPQGLAEKLDRQLIQLNGYSVVPHAALIEQYARMCFNYNNDNFWYQPVPEPVKMQIRLSTKCYRNAEGAILVHKDFKFDHLTPAEFAHLYRILNSYYRAYDTVHHQENAVYHKHLSMMDEYVEGLCWNDRPRVQEITAVLVSYKDLYLHEIIQKQTSYLLNLSPYSLIDHANNWFNFDDSNPVYATVYQPLSDKVKEQIRLAVFTNIHLNGTKDIHKNFRLDHLSPQEVAQLYAVIYSYYDAYDHRMNKDVYKGHIELLQKHIEDICWREPARGIEVRDALGRLNSGFMTGFIQKIQGIISLIGDSALVPHADALITYAENTFNGDNSLSQAVKNNLRLAAVCYQTANGLVVHGHFPSDDLSPEDLATVFRILTAYSNDGRVRLGQADVFQRHLAILEEHIEKLCWNDLEKVERFRAALQSFQDPSFQQMIVKLSYYIANLTGFNLIHHASFWFNYAGSNIWFPTLSEPVKQQVQYATLYHLNINGSVPTLHPNFTFDHLSPFDLVTLYRILKSYCNFPFQQDTTDYRLHLDRIDYYIANELPAGNADKAREVRELMLKMPDDFLNPIIQKLNAHPELRYDRTLFRYLEDQDQYIKAQGGGANVYLYHPNAIFKKVVPPTQGVALKAYFIQTNEEERFIRLFNAEVEFLRTMQEYRGIPRLLDIYPAQRMIMMSAITDKNGLKIIHENPRRTKEVCEKHMRSLVKLHAHTNTAFHIPTVSQVPNGASLADILEGQGLGCVTHFRTTLDNGPDREFSAQTRALVDGFIRRPAFGTYRLAKCLNDTCIESYFPESDTFIDFNGASTSPIERDIAAGIVNLLLNLKYNIGVNPTREEMRAILLGMINSYREEYANLDQTFSFNMDLFRFFFAQQMTIFSNTIYNTGNHYAARNLQQAVFGLLDANQEIGIEAMVDMILAAYG